MHAPPNRDVTADPDLRIRTGTPARETPPRGVDCGAALGRAHPGIHATNVATRSAPMAQSQAERHKNN